MRGALVGPRVLLRRLREVMSEPANAQGRLDRIVVLIANNMVAEVCSVYVARADNTLELYATEGLNREAVHLTTMRLDEGLVGLIAREAQPLALSDAQSHPSFSYKPETGEEIYASFLGVPILRGGNAIGVLVVQNRAARIYSEEEIEALQTTAMVLAEMIAGGELEALARPGSGGTVVRRPLAMMAQPIAEGIGLGHVVLHEPRVVIKNLVADDPEAELKRLNTALEQLRASIDDLMDHGGLSHAGEHRDVLETFRMFAQDRGWVRRLQEAIHTGLTAEAAIERVQQRTRMRMRQIDDPLLQDRMHDLEDLANRLLRIVSGQLGTAAQLGLRQDAILIARNLGPAELLEYDRRRLKGVILEEGSLTAHVTIVARAMGVPVLGRVRDIRHLVNEGDLVLMDVGENRLFIRPSNAMEEAFEAKLLSSQKRRAAFAAMRDLPSVTKDGTKIELMVNAGLRDDVSALDVTGADGMGLFRTEFQFLVSATLPQRERQQRLYRDVLEAAGERPVIFRTVDIGGDKALPYMRQEDAAMEENPAMGWRALRLALERDGLMKAQARALLEAAAGRTLHVMFPMISEPWEFDEARALVEAQRAWLTERRKKVPTAVRYGAMLEVPALAEVLDLLLPKLDFLSIGTNDLTQFLFAADRSHPKLAERYDWLSLAILRFLRRVTRQCQEAKVPVGICGEMGGRTLEAMALLGLGVRRLSITPASVAPVKAMVRSIDLNALTQVMDAILADGKGNARPALTAWAQQQGVELL
mgnify:CR=1 FL=1